FAWRVSGSVHGYAANVVAQQTPAAGTRVFDTGAPTIVLRLARGHYPERGIPEDASSFPGTPLRLADRRAHAPAVPAKPVRVHKRAKKPNAKPVRHAPPAKTRLAAFAVPGAPKEPLKEISLPVRAELLRTWVST